MQWKVIWLHLYIFVSNLTDCGHLPQISNGTLSLTGTTYGNTATYVCARGFDINGKTMRTLICQADGNWSGKTPVCNIKGLFPMLNHQTYFELKLPISLPML